MKKIIQLTVLSVMIYQCAFAQDEEIKLPENIVDLVIDGNTKNVVTLDSVDFLPQANGLLSKSNALDIGEIAIRIQGSLNQVPQGDSGQGHSNFIILQQLVTIFKSISATKDRASFFATIPQTLLILTPDKIRSIELNKSGVVLSAVRYSYVREVAFDISENSANISEASHDIFINMICHGGILSSADWEDEPMPIDSAGIFIVDPINSTTKLKTKSLKELKTFLGGITDNSFFKRYQAEGDGMEILKTKFAAEKDSIQGKLAELFVHVAQLEAQQPQAE